MRHAFLGTVASIGLLATANATTPIQQQQPAVLMAGQIWNGTASSFVATFHDLRACEAAFTAYQHDGAAKIAASRPGSNFRPVFWHTCALLNSAPPS